MSFLKKLVERAHWEVVGDREACIQYCSKGEVLLSRLLEHPGKPKLEVALDTLRSQGVAGVAREHPS